MRLIKEFVVVCLLVVVPSVAVGQADVSKATPKKVKSESVDPEREAAVTTFVEQHHSDLLELLIHLKEALPEEYAQAVRDLSRTQERLEQIQKRDATRYQLELKRWQAESRRQLLTARFQMSRDSRLVKEIREALLQEQDLVLALLKHERDRLSSRIEKLEEQIDKQESMAASLVERKLATLTKSSKNNNPERKVKTNESRPSKPKSAKKPT